MKFRKAAIKGIATHLPEDRLTNEDLARDLPDWTIDKIFNKTGISERRVSGIDECASDLAVAAAKKLFADGVCFPENIEFILFCTQAPDYFLPTSACIIQERLGIPTECGAMDINLGCSGFVYAIALAKGLIESNLANDVLVITADTYTKFINPKDRGVRTLFGDGAAATLVTGIEMEQDAIGPFVFGTDGRGADRLIVPAGGFRIPITLETAIEKPDRMGNVRSAQNLFMDGAAIFNFTLKEVPTAVARLLEKCKLTLDEVDYFVFHQANRFMLESLRKKLKIPSEKFCINMQHYANTVSATIPMALEIAMEEELIKKGAQVMLVGFGVGFSWAAAMVKLQ